MICSGEEIAISLWRECTDVSDKFDRIAIQNEAGPTVIAVTNVKVSSVAGTKPKSKKRKILKIKIKIIYDILIHTNYDIQLSKRK